MKIKFTVKGMSCAACVAHVERAAASVCGKENVSVSLITSSLTVTLPEGVDTDAIRRRLFSAVRSAGYKLSDGDTSPMDSINAARGELVTSLRFFVASAILTAALMTLAMLHMWGLTPSFINDRPLLLALIEAALTLPVVLINGRYFKNGFSALFRLAPGMDSLIAVGASASILYGVVSIIQMLFGRPSGHLYFESAAMILTLVSLGKILEGKARANAAGAVGRLASMLPSAVTVIREGKQVVIDTESLTVGDMILLRAGDTVPVDGVVTEGGGFVDESAVTGESIPSEKQVGDSLRAVSTLTDGFVRLRAEKVGSDTSLAKMIALLESAASSKAPIARVADRVSRVFVPFVMGIAVITAALWLIFTRDVQRAFECAVSVLVISCPCAMGLATPTAIMVGTARGAENGILIKSAAALEDLHRVEYFMTDKTGTLTEGKPEVFTVIPSSLSSPEELSAVIFAAESGSSHPLASAAVSFCLERGMDKSEYNIEKLDNIAGKGVRAELCKPHSDGKVSNICLVGSRRLIEDESSESISPEVRSEIEDACRGISEAGGSVMLAMLDGRYLGALGLRDRVRSESAQAVRELEKMNIKTVMLTGDDRQAARAVGELCGISRVLPGLLPEEKEQIIREYSKKGRTAMAGDGINDAPALASAHVGIAVGAGTEVAIDSADVVLSRNSLLDVVRAVRLSRATIVHIKENLFWALAYNAICIPIAAGVLYFPLGLTLSPMLASAAMSLSSVTVVLNSIRLRYRKIEGFEAAKRKKGEKEEMFEKTRMVILGVDGMMCNNCKAHVEKALTSLRGVKSAEASLEDRTVTVCAKEQVTVDMMKKAVTDAGYGVRE